jgi:hypothetical protein
MKTGTSKLMDNVLNKDNEINKSGNYAEEWIIDSQQEHTLTEGTFKFNKEFLSLPDYVGCYCIGGDVGLKFYFRKKPKWLHRKMMKMCLGWEWIDN